MVRRRPRTHHRSTIMGERRERPKRWAEAKGGRRWWNPLVVFIWIEWCCEWIAYWLSRWAFISILEYLGRLAIVLALVLWIIEIPERKQAQENQRKAKIYQAWQVISTAQGETASGGRHHALRDLIDERQRLHEVNLSQANLSGADLREAGLSEANLFKANLSGADLRGADLRFADLREADLRGGADLRGADLNGAYFGRADLSGADLSGAILGGPIPVIFFIGTSDRSLGSWGEVRSLSLANLWDVKNAPVGFLKWAIGEKGAVSVENHDEWEAMVKEQDEWKGAEDDKRQLYDAWKKKWDEQHGDRE